MKHSQYTHRNLNFRAATVATVVIAVVLAGCQTRTRLTPAADAQRVPSLAQAASEETQGVSIVVEAEAWTGDPQIEEHVTPLRIEIQNHSDRPLRLRYNDFSLVEAGNGARFAALPPYSIDASVSEQVVARFDHSIDDVGFYYDRFHVSPFYRGLYPEMDYWGSPFHHDPFYYDHYHQYWREIPLPTEEMLRLVIPEGVIDPGGSLSGFLYFERVSPEIEQVEFRYELTNANNGERFGMMTIPFLAREET